MKDVNQHRGTDYPRVGLLSDADEEGIYKCVASKPEQAIVACPYELRMHCEWIRSHKMLVASDHGRRNNPESPDAKASAHS